MFTYKIHFESAFNGSNHANIGFLVVITTIFENHLVGSNSSSVQKNKM